jgi:hypothetical protein
MPAYTAHNEPDKDKPWSVLVDNGNGPEEAFPGVHFAEHDEVKTVIDRLAKAERDLVGAREEPRKPVPNSPDKHESVAAVKGQEPRR